MLVRLYLYNIDGLEGDILAVRDLGEKNVALMARFPDRVPLLLRDNGRESPATLTPLERGVTRP